MEFICPFSGKACMREKCAIFYEENDNCSIYQIAISTTNLDDNIAMALINGVAIREREQA